MRRKRRLITEKYADTLEQLLLGGKDCSDTLIRKEVRKLGKNPPGSLLLFAAGMKDEKKVKEDSLIHACASCVGFVSNPRRRLEIYFNFQWGGEGEGGSGRGGRE